jgi:hypothetical protein
MTKSLFTFIFLLFTSALFSQSNWDFSSAATLSGTPWLSTATINIGGVSYTITGGVNGGYSNVSTGGNGNSACLKKTGSGGDNFSIKRTDGKRFQFYNLWLKQSSMYPYPNTPPFYTIRFFNGATEIKNYVVNNLADKNSTKIYAENIAVTSVNVSFNALMEYYLDDLKVGPAAPSNDAGLAKLVINKGTITPTFVTGTLTYTASVGYGTSTINLTPTANDASGAVIKVNGTVVAGSAAYLVPLMIGNNTITIECTAEDKTTIKTYTLTINRSAIPAYCTPVSESSYGDNINSFTLAGESSTSISDLNTGNAPNGYDYRLSVPLLKLLQTKTYSATITTAGVAFTGTDGEHVKIWIDYNDNYVFESNELVYQSPALILAGNTLKFNLNIPADANPGNHRMRVRAIYEDPYNQTNFDACSDEEYGETHDYNINIVALNPMPVTLLSFKAMQVENNINVSWVSSSELNIDRYEVERSSNGVEFVKSGTILAKGSSLKEDYNWTDGQPLDNYNFYRLKMIDKNGEFKYSGIVKVNFNNKKAGIKVIPNPVTNNELGLQLQNLTGSLDISLFEAGGQKVFSASVENNGNALIKKIQLPQSLTKGIYRLQVADKKNVYSTSVLIQ